MLPEGETFQRGAWVAPVVFTATNDMRIAREEVFGPVLTVIGYHDEASAVAIANDSEYGLSAGVWGSPERARSVAERLEAGTVWINDWHAGFPMNPFGGYKPSGIGRDLGPDALAEYTQVRRCTRPRPRTGRRAASPSCCRRRPADDRRRGDGAAIPPSPVRWSVR